MSKVCLLNNKHALTSASVTHSLFSIILLYHCLDCSLDDVCILDSIIYELCEVNNFPLKFITVTVYL